MSQIASLKPQISGLWTCELKPETCDNIFEAEGDISIDLSEEWAPDAAFYF